jgi:hypothetical protein
MLLFSRHLLLLEDIKQKIEKANNEGQTDRGRRQQQKKSDACISQKETRKKVCVCACECVCVCRMRAGGKNYVTLKVKGPFCYSFHVGSGLGKKFFYVHAWMSEDVCVCVCV